MIQIIACGLFIDIGHDVWLSNWFYSGHPYWIDWNKSGISSYVICDLVTLNRWYIYISIGRSTFYKIWLKSSWSIIFAGQGGGIFDKGSLHPEGQVIYPFQYQLPDNLPTFIIRGNIRPSQILARMQSRSTMEIWSQSKASV